LASALPWAASGRRLRDSYELVAVAARLDLVGEPALSASAAWPLLPLAVVLTWLAVLFHRPRWTATLALTVGLSALGLAVAVIRSPLAPEVGARMALVTGSVSVLGALIVWESRGDGRE
jgi:hypothetical protein